jgi:hypothetical protein
LFVLNRVVTVPADVLTTLTLAPAGHAAGDRMSVAVPERLPVASAASTASLSLLLHESPVKTTNDVRSVPAEPHETTIGHRPGGVPLPTFHFQLTRPPTGNFGERPCACARTLLYVTAIEQVRDGATAAVSLA